MDFDSQTTESLLALRDRLEQEERSVSRERARIHERITFLQGGGSASGGDAAVEQLELLTEREREISTSRKQLQVQIEEVRAELLRRRP